MLDHYGRLYEGDLAEAFSSDDLTTRDLVPGNLYYETEGKRVILPYELLKKMDKHYVHLYRFFSKKVKEFKYQVVTKVTR
ncbi:hypothetical protein H7R52_01600 [Weissella confusa]|uniref:Uncharacterized protein n=1 Tax=Weissella confusa TaxID=1583 RepID=A0A923NCX7_WEICO|nr:hypothetical protein [Weissella confusa]